MLKHFPCIRLARPSYCTHHPMIHILPFNHFYFRPQTKFAKVMFSQVSVCLSTGEGHAWLGGGLYGKGQCAWPRGMHVWGAGVMGRGHVWPGGAHAWQGRHVWLGGGMRGRGIHGRGHAWHGSAWQGGACVAGERATAEGGTHPTGMHSCFSRLSHK